MNRRAQSLLVIFIVFSFILVARAQMNIDQKSAPSDLEGYMSRTRKNDYAYELLTQKIMRSDAQFLSECWYKLAHLSFDLFYTIEITGKATEVAWFPKDIDA